MSKRPRRWKAQKQAWAWFRSSDDYGNPNTVKVRVLFWEEDENGELVGLVGVPEGLKPVTSVKGFLRYEHPDQAVEVAHPY